LRPPIDLQDSQFRLAAPARMGHDAGPPETQTSMTAATAEKVYGGPDGRPGMG